MDWHIFPRNEDIKTQSKYKSDINSANISLSLDRENESPLQVNNLILTNYHEIIKRIKPVVSTDWKAVVTSKEPQKYKLLESNHHWKTPPLLSLAGDQRITQSTWLEDEGMLVNSILNKTWIKK